ncbi:MAG: hypothetical protein R3336_01065 [Phycisphaeraceae bacterium]|nr:hypothetical protein [Phycisphaeraceae bacterium]
MSDPILRFVVFSAFSLLALGLGYLSRKRHWMGEHRAAVIHGHTIAWVWSAISLVSLWQMPLERAHFWLLLIQPILVLVPALAMIPLARAIGCNDRQVGVLACAAGLSNTGSTLGAYLCYLLLPDGEAAVGIGIALVSIMSVVGIVALYPLARHYAGRHADARLRDLIIGSLIDHRALPLYASLAGVGLSASGLEAPSAFSDFYVIDILCYLAALGGYSGIGMRLRLGDWTRYLPHHLVLAGMKFVGLPLLAWGIVATIGLTAAPLSTITAEVILVESFMPAAVMSVMIANIFHLDARLASVAWLVNTLLFFLVPLPILLLWLTG